MKNLQGLRSAGKKVAVVAASVVLSTATFVGVAQNTLAAPTFSNISVQSGGGQYNSTFTYTVYLSDTSTTSTIHYTLKLCEQTYTVSGTVSASTSPNKIVATCPSNGIDESTGSAYATNNGSTSTTTYASF